MGWADGEAGPGGGPTTRRANRGRDKRAAQGAAERGGSSTAGVPAPGWANGGPRVGRGGRKGPKVGRGGGWGGAGEPGRPTAVQRRQQYFFFTAYAMLLVLTFSPQRTTPLPRGPKLLAVP